MTSSAEGTPAPRDPLASVISDLEQIDQIPLADQPAVYERMHASLDNALGGTVEQLGSGSR